MNTMQPLPFEKWSILKDSLKYNWPTYAYYYNFLNTLIKWKTKEPLKAMEIYCPDANADAGVFICITADKYPTFYLFSFENTKHLLREMLYQLEQKLNNIWSGPSVFAHVHESIQDVLDDFLKAEAKSKGLRYYTKTRYACYFKAKEDCSNVNVLIPGECELKRINERHIPIIHSHWVYRSIKYPEWTMNFLMELARLNQGYGLFLKKDNSLVSWTLQCNRGCLAIFHTLIEHRRKGYGRIVARALMKYLAEKEQLDVTLFTEETNEAGMRLFESEGFKRVTKSVWYEVNQ